MRLEKNMSINLFQIMYKYGLVGIQELDLYGRMTLEGYRMWLLK